MKIIEKTVYTFAELSAPAKQKAERWYCENVDYFWGDEHISEIKEFLSVFNVELTYYEYDARTFSYRTDLESCKWQGNNKKDVLARLARYQVSYCAGEGLKQSFMAEYVKHGSIKLAIIAALGESFKELCKDYEYHFSDESIEYFFSSDEDYFYFYEDGTIA